MNIPVKDGQIINMQLDDYLTCVLLCEMLRDFKAASNFTNKEIADSLNVPLTKVEHWFRQDSSFAIPDADVWFELKRLLGIEETCFDEAITTFEVKDGVFEKGNRAYDVNGKMSTVMTGKTDKVISLLSNIKP